MNIEVQYKKFKDGEYTGHNHIPVCVESGTYDEIRGKRVWEIKELVAKKFYIRDPTNLRLAREGNELNDNLILSDEPWFNVLEKESTTLVIWVIIKDVKRLEYEYAPPCTLLGGSMLKKKLKKNSKKKCKKKKIGKQSNKKHIKKGNYKK